MSFVRAWLSERLLAAAVALCDAGLWLNERGVVGPGTVLGFFAEVLIEHSELVRVQAR